MAVQRQSWYSALYVALTSLLVSERKEGEETAGEKVEGTRGVLRVAGVWGREGPGVGRCDAVVIGAGAFEAAREQEANKTSGGQGGGRETGRRSSAPGCPKLSARLKVSIPPLSSPHGPTQRFPVAVASLLSGEEVASGFGRFEGCSEVDEGSARGRFSPVVKDIRALGLFKR